MGTAGAAALGGGHLKTLRWLFAQARPVPVTELRGVHLDLLQQGLIERKTDAVSYGTRYDQLAVTDRGVRVLQERRQGRAEALRPHADLAARVAAWLETRGMLTWQNVRLKNPNLAADRAWSEVRPDVYALDALADRIDRARATIVECKVTLSDWRAELRQPQSLAAYSELAGAVYICCPEGMIDPREIPKGVGLIFEVQTAGSITFRYERRARRIGSSGPGPDVLLTLLRKQYLQHREDEGPRTGLRTAVTLDTGGLEDEANG